MRVLNYTVPPEYDGRKLLHFLRGGAGCSYSLVRSLKTCPSGILRNGQQVRTIDRVHTGDQIKITLHDTPKPLEQCSLPVAILYEDDDLIVYNKPSGMACHPVRNLQQGTLANVFAHHCAEQGIAQTCHILNRLDRDTTGAVLIARNAFAAAALTGRVEKCYIAVASGTPDPVSGIIDLPIGQPDRSDPHRMVLPDGQRAVTEYTVIARGEGCSVVRCRLQTGRTHQIRVHLSQIGCPLLGDLLYGGPQEWIVRQALHCASLSFAHPVGGNPLVVDAPFPQDMQNLLDRCEKSW